MSHDPVPTALNVTATVKVQKIQTPKKIAVIILKLDQYHDADRMANSVDPDQTAPQSDLGLYCPGLSVQKLGIIMV